MSGAIVFRVLLILGILANILVVGMITSGGKFPESESGWEQYTSQDAGYSVTYPKTWQVVKMGDPRLAHEIRFRCSNTAHVSVYAITKDSVMADAFNKYGTQFGTRDLKECKKFYVAVLESQVGNFTATPATAMKVAGGEALVISYEGDREKTWTNKPMKGMLVSTWNNAFYISFRFSCSPKEYDEMLQVFSTFLSSVKLGLPTSSKFSE